MGLACGSNGEMISHSPSAISLGYAFRVILEELQLLDLFLSSNDVIARFRPLYISLETASKTDPERILYLAVRDITFNSLFEEPVGQLLIADENLNLIVFEAQNEVIVQWIP